MKFTDEMINELKTALKTKDLSSYHKRIQAVYLRATNTPYKTIMEILDFSHDTIWRLTKKYLEDGLQALVSDARGGRRHAYMTVDEEQDFLSQQLSSAVKGEFITIDSLYEAYQEQIGRKTTKDGFYRLLKRNGWRKVSPRPEHPKKADPKTILGSKNKIFIQKKSSKRFLDKTPYTKTRLMYQDEAGFGRISKLGSCWSPSGHRPTVSSHHIREFRYCYGAVDAHSGESFFIIAGGCNSAWMNEFLCQLSEAYPNDYLILVMDNAIWHKSQTLEIPENIEFTFIPPYTPEMNPIEQVWAEIRKRGFKNRTFQTLESVIDKLQEVIQALSRDILKSIVYRKWICSDFEIE
ncbi:MULTISPECIES: IS630 family transposase [unclassified Streptococcus]|uniref:IS630 family transposase n=1 Tax=unclassified Streptococcus TaxID=2608887 RepID=UPI001D16C47F|nr:MULTISPECIES: IS630 family transposase [unclassified Streptococcus]